MRYKNCSEEEFTDSCNNMSNQAAQARKILQPHKIQDMENRWPANKGAKHEHHSRKHPKNAKQKTRKIKNTNLSTHAKKAEPQKALTKPVLYNTQGPKP